MNVHNPLPASSADTEPMFRVDWAVEVKASSPAEAACYARDIQGDGDNTATVFSVTNKQTGAVTLHDIAFDGAKGTNIAARRPEDTGYVARTLRPGGEYQTRSGLPVEIVEWDREGDYPLAIRITMPDGGRAAGLRTKTGKHPMFPGEPHEHDIVECNPSLVRWVRLYDRKLNAAGKQVVGGKEFAAERGLFMYVFDTEAEARASLQGVRAVFPITYREGEGLG